MPRAKRIAPGGYIYHVLNRGVGRMTLFHKPEDYDAFLRVMVEMCERHSGVALLSFCVMPNHWHLLVRPSRAGDLSQFMRLLTVTHTQRYHAHHRTAGTGPIYQGRFKSFPIEGEGYFLTAARYVERNALRAGLVDRAEDWRWSSLYARRHRELDIAACLSPWPVEGGVPRQWLRTVNCALTQGELDAMRQCVRRGRPMGDEPWVSKTAEKLDLTSSMRPPGRPRRDP